MWNPCLLILAAVTTSDPGDEAPAVRKQSAAKAAVERLYGYTPTRWRRWPGRNDDAALKTVSPSGPRLAPTVVSPTAPAATSPPAVLSPEIKGAADTGILPALIAPAGAEADGDAEPDVQLLEPRPLDTASPKKRTWFAEWLRSIPTKTSASDRHREPHVPESPPESGNP